MLEELQRIVNTPIGHRAFEIWGTDDPVGFYRWCHRLNYILDDKMPCECLNSVFVLLAVEAEKLQS